MTFRNLQYLREKNNLTQSDISQILKLRKDTYGEYERGKTIIPIKHLNSLSKYYNASIDYILGFSNLENYNYCKDANIKISAFRLKEFRKEQKLTQNEIAKILNIAKTTISNYENNRYLIATPFLYEICSKYKISADYLLGKIDSPKYLNSTKK